MSIHNEFESSFKLIKIITSNISLSQADDVELNSNKSFKIEHTITQIRDNENVVSLLCSIKDEKNSFNLTVETKAWFKNEFVDLDEESKKSLFERNSLSIMFPFLRSAITLITSQPNTIPIVLPAMNINAYIEDKNKTK